MALSAYPSTDWFSGLTVRLSDKGAPAGDRSDPVRLGRLDMWRERTPDSGLVRYTAPTTAGTLVVSCEGASGIPGTLRLCERAAVTRLSRSRRAG